MPDSFIKKLMRYLGEGARKRGETYRSTALERQIESQKSLQDLGDFIQPNLLRILLGAYQGMRDFNAGYQGGEMYVNPPGFHPKTYGQNTWTGQVRVPAYQSVSTATGALTRAPSGPAIQYTRDPRTGRMVAVPASNYQWGPYRNPDPYAEWTPNGYITSPSPATPASPAPASPAPASSSGYRSDFAEVMAKMSANNASSGWYGDNGYRYNSQAEALADGNQNVLYFSPSYGTGGGSPSGSRARGSVSGVSAIPEYAVQNPVYGGWSYTTQPTKESITGWGGQGFKNLRNKRRAVWEQRAQENAPATGTGVSSGRVGGMASWRV